MMAANGWIYVHSISFYLALALSISAFHQKIYRFYDNWMAKEAAHDHRTKKQDVALMAVISAIAVYLMLNVIGLNHLVTIGFTAAASLMVPRILVKRRRQKYVTAFDLSLQESLTTIASSLRAGLTLKDSLDVAAKNCPQPFSFEAASALKEYHFGVPIDQALDGIRRRVQTANANMAIGAMVIGSQLGGNLPAVLQRISHTIRERDRVEGKLKSLTAQGRTQMYLLCGAPPAVGIGMYLWDPRKAELLTTTFEGQCLLALAIILELIGVFVTKRILDLDI